MQEDEMTISHKAYEKLKGDRVGYAALALLFVLYSVGSSIAFIGASKKAEGFAERITFLTSANDHLLTLIEEEKKRTTEAVRKVRNEALPQFKNRDELEFATYELKRIRFLWTDYFHESGDKNNDSGLSPEQRIRLEKYMVSYSKKPQSLRDEVRAYLFATKQ